MAAFVRAVQRVGVANHPDPRGVTDAYGNTPWSIAVSRKHDAPLMMEVTMWHCFGCYCAAFSCTSCWCAFASASSGEQGQWVLAYDMVH